MWIKLGLIYKFYRILVVSLLLAWMSVEFSFLMVFCWKKELTDRKRLFVLFPLLSNSFSFETCVFKRDFGVGTRICSKGFGIIFFVSKIK